MQFPSQLPEGALHAQVFAVNKLRHGVRGATLRVMQLLKSPAFSELYAGERETSAPGLRHADGVSDTKNRDDLEVALSAWVEAVPLPHETVEEIYQSMIDRIRGRGNVVPLAVVEEA